MDAPAPANQPPPKKNWPGPAHKKTKKQPQHSAEIVYLKGATLHSLPSLSTILKGITECIIGLQYVWEYRSPSKSVQPHYQCRLCAVYRLQHDMVAHVTGWKHSFKYLQKAYPDMVTWQEEHGVKDPSVRKSVKVAASEVEKKEGRGQIKVILKEPCDVPAFKGLRSAIPKVLPPPPGMGPKGPPFGPRMSGPMFPGEFPPMGGPLPDYNVDDYEESGIGGYSDGQDFPESGMGPRPFQDGMGHHPAQGGDGFGPDSGRGGYGRCGRLEENSGRLYPDEYRGGPMGGRPMNRPMDKQVERPDFMGAASDGRNNQNALLGYLDTFRIENENDAQLVLKVTQKLTDVLMEYRLRSVSAGSNQNSLSMSSSGFSSTSSRLTSNSDRYSGGLSGPSRYPDVQSRFYN